MPTDRDTLLDSLRCPSCVRVAYECDRMPALDESYSQSQLEYVLVAVRHKRLTSPHETQRPYYSNWLWGKSDLFPSYTWLQKFMSFFRVESVNPILLFLFSLLYIIYHRPPIQLQCNHIFLYIIHDSLVSGSILRVINSYDNR